MSCEDDLRGQKLHIVKSEKIISSDKLSGDMKFIGIHLLSIGIGLVPALIAACYDFFRRMFCQKYASCDRIAYRRSKHRRTCWIHNNTMRHSRGHSSVIVYLPIQLKYLTY